MCAVPILICSHWAARGTNMVRYLAAPLSPREISQLLDLRHGKSQSDPAGFKRFIMLALVEERPGGCTRPARAAAEPVEEFGVI